MSGLTVHIFCASTSSLPTLRAEVAALKVPSLSLMMAYQAAVKNAADAAVAASSGGHMPSGPESRVKMEEYDDIQRQLRLAEELVIFSSLQTAYMLARGEAITAPIPRPRQCWMPRRSPTRRR
mmetsp:Transcript_19075/g.65549  ORF Transcript_19075/g.65549 Transcript_19075/m.65549 type:complete len:123 (+) Transcript_19075:353-721(+)